MTASCKHPPGTPFALATTPALDDGFRAGMVQLETYIDTSHESLELWRCRSRGQHWLWWWHETWDFETGDDPVTATLTPLADPEEARLIAAPGPGTPCPAPRGRLLRQSGTNGDVGWHWRETA